MDTRPEIQYLRDGYEGMRNIWDSTRFDMSPPTIEHTIIVALSLLVVVALWPYFKVWGNRGKMLSKSKQNELVARVISDEITENLERLVMRGKISREVRDKWYMQFGMYHKIKSLLPNKVAPLVVKAGIKRRLGLQENEPVKLPDAVVHPTSAQNFLSKFKA